MSKLLLAGALIAGGLAAQPVPAPVRADQAQPDLSRAEGLERADSLFWKLDLNHDGRLVLPEVIESGMRLKAERAATGVDVAPGIGGHTERYMEHRFAGARSVSRPQFEEAMLDHFDDMDKNHDGVLTAAERLQGRGDVERGSVNAALRVH